jgi:hypothetical protein
MFFDDIDTPPGVSEQSRTDHASPMLAEAEAQRALAELFPDLKLDALRAIQELFPLAREHAHAAGLPASNAVH